MKSSALPPIVAGFVALVMSVNRRLSALLLELSTSYLSPETFTRVTLAGRFLVFVLVYALLFGLAYWVGNRTDDSRLGERTAVATGVLGTIGYLAGTGIVLQWLDFERRTLAFAAAVEVGSGIAVGIQLAVVTFAGVALARRGSARPVAGPSDD